MIDVSKTVSDPNKELSTSTLKINLEYYDKKKLESIQESIKYYRYMCDIEDELERRGISHE